MGGVKGGRRGGGRFNFYAESQVAYGRVDLGFVRLFHTRRGWKKRKPGVTDDDKGVILRAGGGHLKKRLRHTWSLQKLI